MTCRQNIAELQRGYYRLSQENRRLIIDRARELTDREPPPPSQEGRKTTDEGLSIAHGDKPDGRNRGKAVRGRGTIKAGGL